VLFSRIFIDAQGFINGKPPNEGPDGLLGSETVNLFCDSSWKGLYNTSCKAELET